jgi:hypothetical protein
MNVNTARIAGNVKEAPIHPESDGGALYSRFREVIANWGKTPLTTAIEAPLGLVDKRRSLKAGRRVRIIGRLKRQSVLQLRVNKLMATGDSE